MFVQFGPLLSTWTQIASIPEFHRIRDIAPNLADSGPDLAESGHFRPKLSTELGPNLTQIGPRLARSRLNQPEFGQLRPGLDNTLAIFTGSGAILARLVLHPENLCGPRSGT